MPRHRQAAATAPALAILTTGFMALLAAASAPPVVVATAAPPPVVGGPRSTAAAVFRSGETLRYRIVIGPLTAGEATLVTRPDTTGRSPGTVTVRLTVRSSGILEAVYPVRDRITSRVTADDCETLLLQRRIREGRRRFTDRWVVDHARGRARELGGDEVATPPGVRDVLAVLWLLRLQGVVARDGAVVAPLPVLLGDGVGTLHVAVGPPRAVTVPAGRDTARSVGLTLGAPPRSPTDASLVVDLAQDGAHTPLRARMALPVVGAVQVELTAVSVSIDKKPPRELEKLQKP
jgi:hypothetical protein